MIKAALSKLLKISLSDNVKARYRGFSASLQERAESGERYLMESESSPLLEPKDQLTVDLLKMYDYARVVRNYRLM